MRALVWLRRHLALAHLTGNRVDANIYWTGPRLSPGTAIMTFYLVMDARMPVNCALRNLRRSCQHASAARLGNA